MSTSPLIAMTAGSGGASRTSSSGVPPPRVRWSTRVVIPGGILLGTLLVLGAAGRTALTPAVDVVAEPAVLKATTRAAAGTVVVQAAGWFESDPYLVHVTALTSGVVRDVLVLEGDTVTAGQVLARLVPDDAVLARDRAAAEHRLRAAATAEAEARLAAAVTTWDNPVDRDRQVAVAEAALA